MARLFVIGPGAIAFLAVSGAGSGSPGALSGSAPGSAYADARLQAVDANGPALIRVLLDGTGSNWVMRDVDVRVTRTAAEPNRGLLASDVLQAYPALSEGWRSIETTSGKGAIDLDIGPAAGRSVLHDLGTAAGVQVVTPSNLPRIWVHVAHASPAAVADAIANVLSLKRIERSGLWMFGDVEVPLPGPDLDGGKLSVRLRGVTVGQASALVADASATEPAFACDQRTRIGSLVLDDEDAATIGAAISIVSGTNGHPERASSCLPSPWKGRVEEFVGATPLGLVYGKMRGEALIRTADDRILRVVSGVGPSGTNTTVDERGIRIGEEGLDVDPEPREWVARAFFPVREFFHRRGWRREFLRLSATIVERRRSTAMVEDDEYGETSVIAGGTVYQEGGNEDSLDVLEDKRTVVSVRDGGLDLQSGFQYEQDRWPLRASRRPYRTAKHAEEALDSDTIPEDSPERVVASIAGECARLDEELGSLGSQFPPSSKAIRAASSRVRRCDSRLRVAVEAMREAYRRTAEQEERDGEMRAYSSNARRPDTLETAAEPPAGLWFVRTFDEKPGWLRAPALANRYAGDSWGDTLAIELDARLREVDLRSRLLSRKLDPKTVDALLDSDLTWECGGTIESLRVDGARSATLQVQYRLRRHVEDELRVVQAGRLAVSSGWHAAPTEKDLRELVAKTADKLVDELVRDVPVDALAGRN
jgi:hypothetical protein